jgi:Tol biopolymer transport system component
MTHFPYHVIEIGRCNMKKTVYLLAFAFGLLIVLSPDTAAQKAQSAEVLLGAALHQEEVEGNLEAAIETYKKLLADYPDNRPVAARALLQMGRCYEKLGTDEARKAYERLVRDYADQSEQVKLASTRLAALARPSPATLTARRLENAPADTPISGTISPDGRYLTYLDWRTDDLVLRDLQTGADRPLTNKGAEGNDSSVVQQAAGGSAWSFDSKHVAYAWYITDSEGERVELRVVSLEGGKPRLLTHYDEVRDLFSIAWSPDGAHIVTCIYPKGGSPQISLVSTKDGSIRALADLKREIYPTTVRFSPDGRHIAYDRLPDEMYPERDIYLMSIDSGQTTPLVQHPSDDYLLGWSLDGKWLVFASDRTGALGLWFVGVSGLKTQGEPTLVKPGIDRILPIGLTRQGALYYGMVRVTEDVFAVDIDPTTAEVTSLPKKAIELFEGGNFSPSYSPDGKFLAYVSRRGNSPYPTNVGNALCVRSIETGQERTFYGEIWRLGLNYIDRPNWSPDGQFIVFSGSKGISYSVTGLYRLDLETRQIACVVPFGPDERSPGGVFSPDGKYIFARRHMKPDSSQIVVRDLESGEERELYRFPTQERGNLIALSPDGRWVSFVNRGRDTVRSLRIMPASGGDPKEIWNFGKIEAGMPSFQHKWSADGRHILFSAPDPSDLPNFILWRVSVEGGKPEKMGLQRRWGIWDLTVRPDGRQIAFAGRGGPSSASELWVLENFLPKK